MINLNIDPEKTTAEITSFIKDTLRKSGFKKLVIGLSGGVDSATVYYLAVRAIGVENIYGVMLPYGDLQRESAADVNKLCEKAEAPKGNLVEIDIKQFVDQFKTIADNDELRFGNIMVRVRMTVLYDMSKKFESLVLGTENKSEYLLGYFTRFGDEASDIEPIRSLYKTQVRILATYLKVPEEIINKEPTAGLWPGQTDEGEFGFSYGNADKILHMYNDLKYTINEIEKEGLDIRTINKVIDRMKANDFKHRLPYIYLK